MLTVYCRCSSDREKKYGEEASMVMQWTVNPPSSGTTGSIPVFSTKNQVESKSHKVNTASLGSMARTYRSRSLYKQRWGKSPHNAFSKFSGIHITVIISDCLSEDGSSTLPCRAKFKDSCPSG
jgi:hypothetical protein